MSYVSRKGGGFLCLGLGEGCPVLFDCCYLQLNIYLCGFPTLFSIYFRACTYLDTAELCGSS